MPAVRPFTWLESVTQLQIFSPIGPEQIRDAPVCLPLPSRFTRQRTRFRPMSQLFVMMRPLPQARGQGDSLLPAALSLTSKWFGQIRAYRKEHSDQQASLLVCGPLTIWQREKRPFRLGAITSWPCSALGNADVRKRPGHLLCSALFLFLSPVASFPKFPATRRQARLGGGQVKGGWAAKREGRAFVVVAGHRKGGVLYFRLQSKQ